MLDISFPLTTVATMLFSILTPMIDFELDSLNDSTNRPLPVAKRPYGETCCRMQYVMLFFFVYGKDENSLKLVLTIVVSGDSRLCQELAQPNPPAWLYALPRVPLNNFTQKLL